MSESEQRALDLLQRNKRIQTSLAEEHHGELLKEIGDGTLLRFDSAVDALRCALKIQLAAKKEQDLVLRIGIHIGDVVFQNGDIFGDGVNIASRIEPFAPANGICISEPVFQMVKNNKDWRAEYLGAKKLKNVEKPLGIYSIHNLDDPERSWGKPEISNKSIAVLPFTNMSNDDEQEYFCDGLTEDILNNLTCVDDLQVISRTSSFALKGRKHNIKEIGASLGVQNILDGSVRKSGNRLRISVQLIKVSDGFMLWSERYDRELKEIFDIQDEIALKICGALEARLTTKEQQVIEKTTTQNIKAYDFYIKGRNYYRTHAEKRFNFAIDMYKKAIHIDPNYALAYAGIADSYSFIYMWFEKTQSNLDLAMKASQKALELDPDLAEAHVSRGLVLTLSANYSGATDEFETAIKLNPQLFEAYYQYARNCIERGDTEKALGMFEMAAKIRPDSFEAAIFQATCASSLGLKSQALEINKRAELVTRNHLELYPEDTRALYLGAGVLAEIGKKAEAIDWLNLALALEPNELSVLYNATCVFAKLGETEKALDLFEKRMEHKAINMAWIEHDPDLDSIRQHPRFLAAIEKLNP